MSEDFDARGVIPNYDEKIEAMKKDFLEKLEKEEQKRTFFGFLDGWVFNTETGNSIRWAVVRIDDLDTEVTADEDGVYLMCVPAGTYRVKYSKGGYYMKARWATIPELGTCTKNVGLDPRE